MTLKLKKIFTLSILLICCVVSAGCQSNYQTLLKNEIEEGNKECPIPFGEYIELSQMKYNQKVNMVQFYFLMDDYYFTVAKSNKNLVKDNILSAFSSEDDTNDLFNLMIKAGSGLELIYTPVKSANELKITITVNELKDFIDNPQKFTKDKSGELEEIIMMEKSICPYDLEDGIIMKDVYLEGDKAVYECLIDENIYNMSDLKERDDILKESVMEVLRQEPAMSHTAKVFAENNKKLLYRYIGNITGKSCDIIITVPELRAIGNTPSPF